MQRVSVGEDGRALYCCSKNLAMQQRDVNCRQESLRKNRLGRAQLVRSCLRDCSAASETPTAELKNCPIEGSKRKCGRLFRCREEK